MTHKELRRLRVRSGLSVVEFGRLVGLTGNDNTISVAMRKMERGKQKIDADIAANASCVQPDGTMEIRW